MSPLQSIRMTTAALACLTLGVAPSAALAGHGGGGGGGHASGGGGGHASVAASGGGHSFGGGGVHSFGGAGPTSHPAVGVGVAHGPIGHVYGNNYGHGVSGYSPRSGAIFNHPSRPVGGNFHSVGRPEWGNHHWAFEGSANWGGWNRGYWYGGRHWWPRWWNGAWGWVPYGPYYGYSSLIGGYGYSWYYCSSLQGYYPDIRACPDSWSMVPAVEPDTSGNAYGETSVEGSIETPSPSRYDDPADSSAPRTYQPAPSPAPQTQRVAPPAPQPAPPAPAVQSRSEGQVYSWTDGDGVTHYTNDLHSVPQTARSHVRVFEPRQDGVTQEPDDESDAE